MTQRDFRFLAALLGCIAASLFFFSWPMQTLWIASFHDRGSAGYAVWFYGQTAAGFLLAVGGVGIVWKWWQGLPTGKRQKGKAKHCPDAQ